LEWVAKPAEENKAPSDNLLSVQFCAIFFYMVYFLANAIVAVVWLTLFLLRKDLRKEILLMSFFAAPFAALDIFFVPSYWKPITFLNLPIGIEGFIFAFEIGGIAAAIYPELLHKKLSRIKNYHKPIGIFISVTALSAIMFSKLFELTNIMINLYIILLFGSAIIVYGRKDLLKSTLLGGILFGTIYFISFFILNRIQAINDWFVLEGLPRIFILDVPLYEILFAVLFGAYWGNLYELFFGYRFKTFKR